MKLLCVECDAPMKFGGYEGPEEGSLAIRFLCPQCGKSTALLTNPLETQLVSSLGVKIGGRTVPPEPLEQTKSSLESEMGKCPFANMLAEDQAVAKNESGVTWTREAEARMDRVPSFVRPMARKAIEKYAEQKGTREITESFLNEAREKVGM